MAKDLETKCKEAILTIPKIKDILQDINLKLTHVIECGKNRFYIRPGTRDNDYHNYNGDQYLN